MCILQAGPHHQRLFDGQYRTDLFWKSVVWELLPRVLLWSEFATGATCSFPKLKMKTVFAS